MRKQTKIAAIASAAALLAIGASMTASAAGWDTNHFYETGEWIYLDSDGQRVYGEWKRDNGKWYYLSEETGVMVTDEIIPYESESVKGEGSVYYAVDVNGARIKDAWKYVDNTEEVEVNGVIPDGIWYYFGSDGRSKSNGQETIGGVEYRFDADSRMIAGWYYADDDKVYYYNDMVSETDSAYGGAFSGWVKLNIPASEVKVGGSDTYDELDENQAWYYFKNRGMRVTGEQYIDHNWWHFNEYGQMKTGFQACATPSVASFGNSAFFTDNGNKARSTWVFKDNWYYVDNYGTPIKMTNGRKDADGNYMSGNAHSLDGSLDGGDDAANVVAIRIKGKTYLLDETGKMLSGLYKLDKVPVVKGGTNELNGIYYFSSEGFDDGGTEGWMITNARKTITDEYDASAEYYFQKNGTAYTNEIVSNSYYNGSGKKVYAEYETYEPYKVTADAWYKGEKVIDVDESSDEGKQVLVSSSGTIVKSRAVSGVEGYKKYYVGKAPSENDLKDKTLGVDYVWMNGYNATTAKDAKPYDITCVIYN